MDHDGRGFLWNDYINEYYPIIIKDVISTKCIAGNGVIDKASILIFTLHVLTFKKSKWIPKEIGEIKPAISQGKSGVIF